VKHCSRKKGLVNVEKKLPFEALNKLHDASFGAVRIGIANGYY
jgi:hypothetical protein